MSVEQENDRIRAQVAFFSGDDHVRREAAPWKDRTPTERLHAAAALCRQATRFLARLEPDRRARALVPDPLPEDALALLQRMRDATR